MTYKDKSANSEWRLLDYIAIRRTHLPRFYQTRVLRGGQTAPSLSGLSLGAKCGEHLGPHIRPDLYAAEEETLCENLSLTVGCVWAQGPSVGKDSGHLDLSGMTWSEATQKLFHQARMALGFQKHKMAYWAYDFKEVEEIVAERKAAGNSVEAHRVAK